VKAVNRDTVAMLLPTGPKGAWQEVWGAGGRASTA